MIFIKLLPPILALLSGILHLGLANKWRDRRTKKHRVVLGLTVIIMILAMLATLWIIIEDDKKERLAQEKLNMLQENGYRPQYLPRDVTPISKNLISCYRRAV
jgi:hypothetical protein